MKLLVAVLALLKSALPLPGPDAASVKAWLDKLYPDLKELIALIVEQFATNGCVAIGLPSGAELRLYGDGELYLWDDGELEECQANGRLLELLKLALPILIQLLPFFLMKKDEDKPAPVV